MDRSKIEPAMSITWTIVVIVGMVAFIFLALEWKNLLDSKNSGIVAAGSLALSTLGIYGSVLGFTLSIQQIRRTRTASEASEATLDDIKGRLGSLTAVSDVERARLALDGADTHIIKSDGENFRAKILTARQAFVRLGELNLPLFSDLQAPLASSISEMDELADSAMIEDNKDFFLTAPKIIRRHADLVSKMQVRIGRG